MFSFKKLYSKNIIVCSTCEFKSLEMAIESSCNYDSIIVEKGIYKEFNVIISKPLTIFGKGTPTIDGNYRGEIFEITSENVTIEGFNIINVGESFINDNAAIRIKNSKNVTIKNNIFKNIFFGIYLEKSSFCEIYNNSVIGNATEEFYSGNGIHLWHCKNILIENNIIKNVRDGIYLEFSNQCNVMNNISQNNLRYGLHFMFSNDDTYRKNNFQNNGSGVAVMFSKNIEMLDNVFQENWGSASYGLLIKEINDSKITNNVFLKNTLGVNMEGSNRINFKGNDFIKNGWAIRVRGASYSNSIVKNNFINNTFDISYNGNINKNLLHKNYWSKYNGYDINKDGVGDLPHRPVSLFSYIVNKSPGAILLIRSLFALILDFSERAYPIFTPTYLIDNEPSINKLE